MLDTKYFTRFLRNHFIFLFFK